MLFTYSCYHYDREFKKTMLRFDEWGLVVDSHAGDGGDSANRAGLLALFGWPQDLSLFEKQGRLCRHPSQTPWNSPGNFTRDQLLPWMAGAWRQGRIPMARRVFWAHARRGFFAQNFERDAVGSTKYPWPHRFRNDRGEVESSRGDFADLLGPEHVWHLILCAKIYLLYPFAVIGYPWLMASVIFHGLFNRSHDEGQILCLCVRAGAPFVKLYQVCHPDWRQSLQIYWRDRRKMNEVSDLIIAKL